MIQKNSRQRRITGSAALLLLAVTIGCTTTVDEKNRSDDAGPRPTSATIDESAAARLYQRKCSTCHAAPVIAHFADAEWRSIMPGMAREARLTRAETRALTDYVIAVNDRD